jgi:hypothetical protein
MPRDLEKNRHPKKQRRHRESATPLNDTTELSDRAYCSTALRLLHDQGELGGLRRASNRSRHG